MTKFVNIRLHWKIKYSWKLQRKLQRITVVTVLTLISSTLVFLFPFSAFPSLCFNQQTITLLPFSSYNFFTNSSCRLIIRPYLRRPGSHSVALRQPAACNNLLGSCLFSEQVGQLQPFSLSSLSICVLRFSKKLASLFFP